MFRSGGLCNGLSLLTDFLAVERYVIIKVIIDLDAFHRL
jgi:hypothetical protein